MSIGAKNICTSSINKSSQSTYQFYLFLFAFLFLALFINFSVFPNYLLFLGLYVRHKPNDYDKLITKHINFFLTLGVPIMSTEGVGGNTSEYTGS